MEITYQRNLHKSYMCIEEAENVVEEHELMMLQRYRIPQLLPMQTMIQDGKVQYWFEITGKQQLKDYLGGRPIGMECLRMLLLSLEQLCQKIPEFLLKEERICLREEMLYVDLQDETVYFTYLPFWKEDFPEEFREWMEEILKRINHQDRECTELAYNLYEQVRRENISIRGLLNEQKWEKEPEKIEQAEEEYIWEPEKKEVSREKFSWDRIRAAGLESFEKLQEYLKSAGRREKEKEQVILPEIEEVFPVERKQVKNPTEPLTSNPKKLEGKLIYQGRNACQDFWIEKEEFLIGRSVQQADGKILTDGISRVHAKIIKREGDYYIEDLNSTNGTYLNGELLEYHRDRKLKRNDRVRFGIEEYVFC